MSRDSIRLQESADLVAHARSSRVAGAARSLYDTTMMALRGTGGSGVVMSGERSEGQLWPSIHASQLPPERATFVRCGERPRLIQIARRD